MSKTLREHIEWQEELGREIGRGIVFTQYLAMCAQKEDYALPAPMNFDHKWVMEKVKKNGQEFRQHPDQYAGRVPPSAASIVPFSKTTFSGI